GGEADDEQVIRQLLNAISDLEALPISGSSLSEREVPFDITPKPYADLRFIEDPRYIETLRDPGGSVPLRSVFYIERDADERLKQELSKLHGKTITIHAPRQTGKTSLLIRGIAQAQQQGSKVVSIDLQPIDDTY